MIGHLSQFWGIVRELDPRDIEREVGRAPSVRLIGEDGELLDRLAPLLFGGPDSGVVERVEPAAATVAEERDLNLVVLPADRPPSAAERRLAHALPTRGGVAAVIVVADASLDHHRGAWSAALPYFPPEHVIHLVLDDDSAAQRRLVEALVELAPAWRLGLARQFPPFRREVASRLVRETSSANAQFALMSSLPAVVPLLGGLVGNAADLVVLTKNQALLLLKLAGIYERDLSAKTRLMAELAPVVGGAFVWRSVARSLIGLVPSMAAAVPKTAVAFLATYLVGQMAWYYYHFGQPPDRQTVRRFREEGWRLLRAAGSLRPPKRSKDHK